MAEMMKTKTPKNNFTSYLNAELPNGAETTPALKPKLLPRELVVISAQNVLLYPPPNKSSQDVVCKGLLVVTNFKLSFISNDSSEHHASTGQESTFLGAHDVTLSNIDSLYQITDRKRRQIVPNTRISSKLHGLHVVCKNFRVLKFGLRHCAVDDARRIVEGLLKFAFPNQHSLLFSYEYRENYYNTLRNITMFNKAADWKQELIRCGATGWRVLNADCENGIPNGTLPMQYVVPKMVIDVTYLTLANYFRNARGAIWVYGLGDAALVRMADLLPTVGNGGMHENQMIEFVRSCSASREAPCIIELSKCLPSVQDVQGSYTKLKELCTPDSMRKFANQDQRFYSALDKSSWLLHVSLCLQYANKSAQTMRSGITVVLQECDGRDTSCVLSSLTQLLLDPVYRTCSGFASLLQKDWVALGHPFSDRLGHVINGETTEQSPLLLLFLDCVWQLVQQFPFDFEFSETFLTSVWDAAFLPIFDTFLFNCERDRQTASRKEKLVLRPVWDWGEQFSDKDLLLFTNPLYRKPVEQPSRQSMAIPMPSGAIRLPGLASHRLTLQPPSKLIETKPITSSGGAQRFLEPAHRICDLAVWHQCYHRWLPILDLHNGGTPQIDLYHRMLFGNVARLQQALQTGDFDELPTPTNATEVGSNLPAVNAFFPFGSATATDAAASGLCELLTELGNDGQADGSIFDGLSISIRGPD